MQGDVAAPIGERVRGKQLSVRVSRPFREWLDAERGAIPREHYMLALALAVGDRHGGELPNLPEIRQSTGARFSEATPGTARKTVIVHPTLKPDQLDRVSVWAKAAGVSPALWVHYAAVQGRLLGLKVLP